MQASRLIKDLTRAENGARKVYILTGLAGHVLHLRPLGKALRHKWHMRGILYPVFAGGKMACPSLEHLAERMTAAVDDAEQEPVLIGYSVGGVIAFEIARRLADQGKRPTVVMIDTQLRQLASQLPDPLLTRMAARSEQFIAALPRKLRRFVRRELAGAKKLFWTWPAAGLRHLWNRLPQRFRKRFAPKPPTPHIPGDPHGIEVPHWISLDDPLMEFYIAQTLATRRYVPSPAPVPVVVVRARPYLMPEAVYRMAGSYGDHGWHLVTEVLGVVVSRGSHGSIVDNENLPRLAKAVDMALKIAFDDQKIRQNGAVRED